MEVYTGDSSNDRFTSVSAHKVPPTHFQWFRCQMEEILRLSEPVWYSRADKTRRRDTGKFLRSPKLSPTVAQPGLVWVLLCVHCPTWQIQKYRTQAGLMGTTWQVQKYNIQASSVQGLMCIQQIQNHKIQPSLSTFVFPIWQIQNTKYVLLCVQPGAYRRSDCPADWGLHTEWRGAAVEKSALLEDGQGRVGKQSRIRKQIADQHSRVGKHGRVGKATYRSAQ